MPSKSQLAVALSKLKGFDKPKDALEQYRTDGDTAADLLHKAQLIDGIEGKRVADLGAGTGILGIGCLQLGASHVTFVEIDEEAITLLEENLAPFAQDRREIIHGGVQHVQADIVVMNPPFGVQRTHADRPFLLAAFSSAPIIYSLHLAGSEGFLDALCNEHGYARTHTWDYELQLARSMKHHRQRTHRTAAIGVRLERRQPL